MKQIAIIILVCGLLAGCGTDAPPPTPPDEGRNPPTLVSPGWTEATVPISADNVNMLTFLGRLDPPSVLSTVFTADTSPDGTGLVGLTNEQVLSWNLVSGALDFASARLDATQVYYSPDKTEVYAIYANGFTNILNADTGVAKAEFNGHAAFNGTSAYAADMGWLALGGSDGTVRVWDTLERVSMVTLNAHTSEITALAFSPDGLRLVTGSADGRVRLWDWQARAQLAETEIDVPPIRVAFAPDGGQVAVGTGIGALLWTPDTGSTQPIQTGQGGASTFLGYTPDGRYLVGGSLQSGIYLWTPDDGALVSRLPGVLGDRVGMDLSPDGALLATSVLGGAVSIWNLDTVTEQGIVSANLNVGTNRIFDVRWTPDGLLLLLFDAGGAIYVWGVGPSTPTAG